MAHSVRLAAALALTLPPIAHAQGRQLLPPQPSARSISQSVQVESTQLQVQIKDGIASCKVKMLLRNDSQQQAEKILLLPIPKGASADGLEMLVNGQPTKSEVLSGSKARSIYEDIVRRRRDPALLEYVSQSTLRLRVFPIPARGKQEVSLRYRLLLRESGGLYAFEYPTRALEAGQFSMDIAIETKQGLKNIYSPIQGWDIARKDEHHARASFECKGRPVKDPIIYYSLDDRDFGLGLLTYRPKGKQGYFLLMLSPKREWENEEELKKSVTFVLDTSGSMQGAKIEQAKKAMSFFLRSLKPQDRFNIVPFATEARPFAAAPVDVSPNKVQEALAFASGIDARGGTNIHEALTFALKSQQKSEHVPIVVFLTDGLPTVGLSQVDEILRDCRKANASQARVFVFGVGHDVNTKLLDSLSRDFRGERDYVRPGENLELKLGALFEKIAYPVLSDCRIECDKVQLSQMAPKALPDLFRGSRIVVAGRYSGSGPAAIRLQGLVNKQKASYVFDALFPEQASEDDFVATIWAQRRVGGLLEAIRLNGQSPELIAEIQRLGKEYGIVTPYTSHLIVEEKERVARRFQAGGQPRVILPTGSASDDRLREELRRVGHANPDAAPQRGLGFSGADKESPQEPARQAKQKLAGLNSKSQGKAAVDQSIDTGRLAFLSSLSQKRRDKLWSTQRVAGRVLHFVAGIWVDSRYRPEHENKLEKIEAFSEAYFALLRAQPELGKLFAFSTSIVTIVGERAIQIIPAKPAVSGASDK